MSYLKYEDYVPQGLDLHRGESKRLFHCRTGQNSDKLYVTKRDDGVILAYCHHCGAKGKYTPDDCKVSIESVLKETEKYLESSNDISYGEIINNGCENDLKLPNTLAGSCDNWPPEAVSWVFKNGITMGEVVRHKINYCLNLRRVILPVYTIVDKLSGYVSRKVHEDDKYPKYLLHKYNKSLKMYKESSAPTSNPFSCVITEDILSGIKCARYVDSYAILGVNLPERLLRNLVHYDTVYVFLDNDSDIVKQKQTEMRQKLLQFVDNVIVIEHNRDPKEHSDLELKELFKLNKD